MAYIVYEVSSKNLPKLIEVLDAFLTSHSYTYQRTFTKSMINYMLVSFPIDMVIIKISEDKYRVGLYWLSCDPSIEKITNELIQILEQYGEKIEERREVSEIVRLERTINKLYEFSLKLFNELERACTSLQHLYERKGNVRKRDVKELANVLRDRIVELKLEFQEIVSNL